MSKRLLFVTGTRADYGKLEPLAHAAQQAEFAISFFITGMHMMRRYGETRLEVKRFPGADFFEFVNQREGDAQDFILSKTILGFSDFVHEHRPDLVIIHGDRVEALAAAIVCAMKYIPSAHIEGGEVSGTIDESIRHCNTKLCATHFVSSEAARARVLALGESPDSVYNIGSPELDTHARPSGVSIEEVKARYAIPFDEYGIAVFHPVTSEADSIGAQAASLFGRLEASGKCFVVIAPNNDPGTEDIFAVLERLPKERFRFIPSMRFNYFSELMKNAAVMVGNSSAGVREAPFLGLPSLDVGTRQMNRAQSPSIQVCSAYEIEVVDRFLAECWAQCLPSDDLFGSGDSAARFAAVLLSPGYWGRPAQKVFAS
ncbi:MAG: UDP-N-acetylglucosamine 2-epimerase [Hydrogenophaga sp.]|uniref:UDP-N-acetylglucosamine 2-epimerase n=1 Tax=Hydrogenophaga sp. TaxID=1904254 RepID=UPI00276F0115|nr:UDP-N-acetylglucosamine 2-epimerase [Hydrogenophaga sp.]MDP2417311.1 UDP-N-acetylglucosamine 2-epimerase [Hydrogenophaga sp.]MDZ4187162.1 UDP-N-acetylglucosamine 2-epimerase [Hydrogenophaga sp.]